MKRVFFQSKITYEHKTIIFPNMRDPAHEIFLPSSDAGFRPGSRATFVSAKVAKTIDAPSGLIGTEGRQHLEERTNSPGSDKVRNG